LKYQKNVETPENLILKYKSQEIENKLRVENTQSLKGEWRLVYGVNYELAKYNNNTFNRISTPNGLDTINYQTAISVHKLGAFGQISKKFMDNRLSLAAGLRTDMNSFSKEMSNPIDQLSPRLSASFAINDKMSVNANTGIYYQLPPYTAMGYQRNGELVNKTNGIKYIRNTHLVGGFEWNLPSNTRFTIEGYYKKYNNYPFVLKDSISLANLGTDFGVIGNTTVTSVNEGRTYGLEVLLQQRLYKGFYGIIAYTFGKSEFKDKRGEYAPSSWDSRHIVSLLGGKRLPKNWEIGLKWRFQTGLPYTPADLNRSSLVSVWDVTGQALPNYNLLNTERRQNVHGLDIRVDKKFFFRKWNLNVYMDIQNAYRFKQSQNLYLLDKDEAGNPIITNPNTPFAQYKLKTVVNESGSLLPSIGIVLEI
jgi:hypothetical protein